MNMHGDQQFRKFHKNGMPKKGKKHNSHGCTFSHSQRLQSAKKQTKEALNNASIIDQDDNFAFIIGYTSGGAAYGLRWDEADAEIFSDGCQDGKIVRWQE